MPTLALAGGTSKTLGRAITTAVLSGLYTKTAWRVVLLSRTTTPPRWLQAIDPSGRMTEIHAVDYLHKGSVAKSLGGVDTVISVTSAIDGSQPRIQFNLLEAAVQAGCRRFVPSHWGMGRKAYERGTFGLMEGGVWKECLKRSGDIETARFNNGLFLNYFAYGILPLRMKAEAEAPSLEALKQGNGYASVGDMALEGLSFEGGMADGEGAFFVSLNGGLAEVPVKTDGSWPRLSLTTVRDVGRYVAASLDLPRWNPDMNIMGDTLSFGDLISEAERITGKAFRVERWEETSLDPQLAALEQDEPWRKLGLEFKKSYCRDEEGLGWSRPTVNQMCPHVRLVRASEFLEKWWREVNVK